MLYKSLSFNIYLNPSGHLKILNHQYIYIWLISFVNLTVFQLFFTQAIEKCHGIIYFISQILSIFIILRCCFYSRQQNYSSTCNYFCDFFSGLIASFYHLMLVTNSIKLKDYDLTNIYLIKLH